MAAVIGIRLGNLTKKLVHFSFSHHKYVKGLYKSQFHSSAFLAVTGQEIKMPSLSPTMTEGTIVKWQKKEGDSFAPGEILCDIQTDKAVVSLEADEEGILAKILLPDNTKDIKVGTLIALMVNEGEDWKDVEYQAKEQSGSSASDKKGSIKGSPVAGADKGSKSSEAAGSEKKRYGPAVRYILERYGVKPENVTATGRKNRILKEDILKHVKENNLSEVAPAKVPPPEVKGVPAKAKPGKPGAPPSAPKKEVLLETGEFIEIAVSSMRKTIARRLTESKTMIPHAYSTIVCDITNLLKFRKRLKAEGYGVSINDLIIKAAGHALQDFPEVNAHWKNNQLIPVRSIDISIAVATESGLITPIIFDVPGKGLTDICSSMRDLASRAREGKLQPHEFQGGSFTISNLGMFGVKTFTAIINPPQCAILAVGTGQVMLGDCGKVLNNMCISLSYDSRAFDELVAADFLKAVRDMLEDPSMIILGGFQLSKEIELEA